MPKAAKKTETKLGDQNLAMAIRKYHAIKESRKKIEKDEEDLKAQMIKLLVPYEQEFGTNIYIANGAKVTLVPNIGRAIVNVDKLLEQGVDPEVVGKATSRTPYTVYNTGEVE